MLIENQTSNGQDNPMGLSEDALSRLNPVNQTQNPNPSQQTPATDPVQQTPDPDTSQENLGDLSQNQTPDENQNQTPDENQNQPDNRGLGNLVITGEEESIFDDLLNPSPSGLQKQSSSEQVLDFSKLNARFGKDFKSLSDVETFIDGLRAEQELSGASRMRYSQTLSSDLNAALRNGVLTQQEISSAALSHNDISPERFQQEMIAMVKRNLATFGRPSGPDDVKEAIENMSMADQSAILNTISNNFKNERQSLIGRIQSEQESQKIKLAQARKDSAERISSLDRAAQEVAKSISTINGTSTVINDSQRKDVTWGTQLVLRMMDDPQYRPLAEALLHGAEGASTRDRIENCMTRLYYAFNPYSITRDLKTSASANTRRQIVQEVQNTQTPTQNSLGQTKPHNPLNFGTPDFSRALDNMIMKK